MTCRGTSTRYERGLQRIASVWGLASQKPAGLSQRNETCRPPAGARLPFWAALEDSAWLGAWRWRVPITGRARALGESAHAAISDHCHWLGGLIIHVVGCPKHATDHACATIAGARAHQLPGVRVTAVLSVSPSAIAKNRAPIGEAGGCNAHDCPEEGPDVETKPPSPTSARLGDTKHVPRRRGHVFT